MSVGRTACCKMDGARNPTYRLDKVSLLTVPLSASDDPGSLLLSALDVAHHSLPLDLRDHRTLVDGWFEWVSNLELLGGSHETFDKFVVDFRLDVDSGTGAASLTMVEAEIRYVLNAPCLDDSHIDEIIRARTQLA